LRKTCPIPLFSGEKDVPDTLSKARKRTYLFLSGEYV
jgi:hypothetical protein